MHLVPGREFSSGSTDIIEACGRCWCTLADSVRLSSNKPWVSAPRRPSHLFLLTHSRPSMAFRSSRQPSQLGLMPHSLRNYARRGGRDSWDLASCLWQSDRCLVLRVYAEQLVRPWDSERMQRRLNPNSTSGYLWLDHGDFVENVYRLSRR